MDKMKILFSKLDEIEELCKNHGIDYNRKKYEIQFEEFGLSFYLRQSFNQSGEIDKSESDPVVEVSNEIGESLRKQNSDLFEYINVEYRENFNVSNSDKTEEKTDAILVFFQSGIIAKGFDDPKSTAYIY